MQAIRKLHIGGECHIPGWENLNIIPDDSVDHVCDASDLPNFEDDTFSEIYASHVISHFGFANIERVLNEWRRILIPGGNLFISVPDIDILLQLIRDTNLSYDDRLCAMKMIYGRQSNKHDYHQIGFNLELLVNVLAVTGFDNLRRVKKFGLIDDRSNMELSGRPISLSIAAVKPL